jgi:hypothetical protein
MRQREKLPVARRSIGLRDQDVDWRSSFSMTSWFVSGRGPGRQLTTVGVCRHGKLLVNSSYKLSVASVTRWSSVYAVRPPGEFVEKGL